MKRAILFIIIIISSFIFFPLVTLAETKKVIMIGSSSFAGFCDTYHFHDALTLMLPDYKFDCFPKSGASPTWFLDKFKTKEVQDAGYTDLIVYAGLNGLGSGSDLKTAQSKLTSLFDLAKQKNMRVIVVSAQPFKGYGTWTETWGANIITNNAWAKNNKNVDKFIDTYSLFDDGTGMQKKEYMGGDKLHVNKKGQELTFQLIAQEAYGLPQGIDPNSKPAINGNPVEGASVIKAIKNTPLSEDELKTLLQKPQPKIKIPGLNFSDITIDGQLSGDDLGNTYLNIPFFGEYMAAVYKYLVVIAGIFCLVRIIVGGFLFTIPDTSGNSKSTGKNMIVQAVTGLLLSVSSYVILYTINPNLVQFRNLKVLYIHGKPLLEIIDPGVYTSVTGQPNLPKGEIVKLAIKAGTTVGFTDPCYMVTILAMESGAKANAIGHDENAKTNTRVGSRKKFLLSGIKKSGESFAQIVQNPSEYDYKIHNKSTIVNDDIFTNSPPDFGLDWNFTHGFGLGQITFGDKSYCNEQRGIQVKDVGCFTIPQLLQPEGNLTLTAAYFREGLKCAGKKGLTGDEQLMGGFYAYNAGCGGLNKLNLANLPNHGYVQKAMGKYAACKKDPEYQNNIPDVSQEEFETKNFERNYSTDMSEIQN